MPARLMTPFCYAALAVAALMADPAFAGAFGTAPGGSVKVTGPAAPGDMGGLPVGESEAALGISAELWEAA